MSGKKLFVLILFLLSISLFSIPEVKVIPIPGNINTDMSVNMQLVKVVSRIYVRVANQQILNVIKRLGINVKSGNKPITAR